MVIVQMRSLKLNSLVKFVAGVLAILGVSLGGSLQAQQPTATNASFSGNALNTIPVTSTG